ncbi:MAG: DUF456 domain-containing protein, partial [Planctomycetota bacterium]
MSIVLVCQILVPILGLVGPLIVLIGLPGTWMLLALAGLAEWWTAPSLFSTTTMIGVLVLAALGELWEFLSSSVRARQAGAGRLGSVGALGGGIVGAILGTIWIPVPLVGTLVGGGLGAFALASLLERSGGRPLASSLRIGRAAAVGQLLGLLGKLAVSVTV